MSNEGVGDPPIPHHSYTQMILRTRDLMVGNRGNGEEEISEIEDE